MTDDVRKTSNRRWFAGIVGLALVSLLCGAASAQAENWSRFRGPNGSGLAGDVQFPATWTDQDYLWKIPLPGIGPSSPVGWENRIFVTSGNADAGVVTLHCIAADTGKQLWHSEFVSQSYPMHAHNRLAASTPTVDEKHVYVTWASAGKMHCAALTHEGEDVWRTELGTFVGNHGFAASPVFIDGVVCVQSDRVDDGGMTGIDAMSGKVRWRAKRPLGKASYATPCFVSTVGASTTVICQSMTGGMQAVDVQSGDVLWQFVDAFPARCVSSPICINDMVIGVCGGGGGGKQLVGIAVADEPAERLVLTKQLPYVPSPLVIDQWMFLWHDQGRVSLVDLSSDGPDQLRWTKRVGGKFFGSPVLAGDKIYCLSSDGRAVVIAAGPEFEQLGENDLGAPTNSTPAVHRGNMYLRTDTTLACLPGEQ